MEVIAVHPSIGGVQFHSQSDKAIGVPPVMYNSIADVPHHTANKVRDALPVCRLERNQTTVLGFNAPTGKQNEDTFLKYGERPINFAEGRLVHRPVDSAHLFKEPTNYNLIQVADGLHQAVQVDVNRVETKLGALSAATKEIVTQRNQALEQRANLQSDVATLEEEQACSKLKRELQEVRQRTEFLALEQNLSKASDAAEQLSLALHTTRTEKVTADTPEVAAVLKDAVDGSGTSATLVHAVVVPLSGGDHTVDAMKSWPTNDLIGLADKLNVTQVVRNPKEFNKQLQAITSDKTTSVVIAGVNMMLVEGMVTAQRDGHQAMAAAELAKRQKSDIEKQLAQSQGDATASAKEVQFLNQQVTAPFITNTNRQKPRQPTQPK
jgi:hypothetical protein